MNAVSQGKPAPPPGSEIDCRIYKELSVDDGILMRADKIYIPDAPEHAGQPSIRSKLVEIAHEGHPGETMMKRFMRSRLWFPKMDKAIQDTVRGCLACQAATETKHRDPNTPSKPPEKLWQKLSADHWGPTADGTYLLVVIDELSRYPEVAVVKGTGAEHNIQAFDDIFTRHGYCERLKTDNGPPFNGKEHHKLQEYFKWAGIRHEPTLSAEDPEANGLAEAFMKVCKKVWHTAIVERNDPRAELNKTLQMYRATPHPTTGKAPAELLFGRKFHSRLPQVNEETQRQDIEEARQTDIAQKEIQSRYKNDKPYIKHHRIKLGDSVLLKQQSTKSRPPFDPSPYKVTSINGHQITATRDDRTVTRDAQKWKIFKKRDKSENRQAEEVNSNIQPRVQWDFEESETTQTEQLQIVTQIPQQDEAAPIRNDFVRRSTRPRRAPVRYAEED